MPWDGCELWVGEIGEDGRRRLDAQRVAGGPTGVDLPAGVVARRHALLRLRPHRLVEPLPPQRGRRRAPWRRWRRSSGCRSGSSACRPTPSSTDETIVATYTQHGTWHLATLDTASGADHADRDALHRDRRAVRRRSGSAVLVAGGPTLPTAVVRSTAASEQFERSSARSTIEIDPGYLSVPEPIEFPTEGGLHRARLPLPAAEPGLRGARRASCRRCSC